MKTVPVTLFLLLFLCLTAPAQTLPRDETPGESIAISGTTPFPDQNKTYKLFLSDGQIFYGVQFLEHVGNKSNNWWRISYTSTGRPSDRPGLPVIPPDKGPPDGPNERYQILINLDQATRLAEVNAPIRNP